MNGAASRTGWSQRNAQANHAAPGSAGRSEEQAAQQNGPSRRATLAAGASFGRNAPQRAGRRRKPPGLHLVVLGPDGTGKSTAIESMSRRLSPRFRQVSIHHWAPRLFRPAGDDAPVPEPHASALRSAPASLMKLAYLWFDFTVGHFAKVRVPVARSHLVIFDRYFPDLLVDSRRYRYGGPAWLARLAWRLMPKPDLVILLDAPAAVVQQRVREVSFEETERQRKAYRALVGEMPNGHIVNADQDPDLVAGDTTRIVLEFTRQRTDRRVDVDSK
jgi:thymidylate kinase